MMVGREISHRLEGIHSASVWFPSHPSPVSPMGIEGSLPRIGRFWGSSFGEWLADEVWTMPDATLVE